LLTLWLDERQLQECGWRIPFAAGLLLLPIGLYNRLNLAETFSGRGRQASTRNLLGELFGNHRRALLLGLLILSGS
ncbi:MFS transporter, partial [Pseudomonas aeruginosa]